ncbi:MAG: hypothetical protein P8N68_04005 [Paracoccaceae bacterium]|nr:hypothetical protein [Paracoccaceae bacterium]
MDSELQGRLRNTQLPYQSALIPLFEAVVNSIQSIEERCQSSDESFSQHRVEVRVFREKQGSLAIGSGRKPENPIVAFEIVDTGIGFTDNNWNSFNKLDSLWKMDKGCRGIGRLMWLKAFSKVQICSVFYEAGVMRQRRFVFDVTYDKASVDPAETVVGPRQTTVRLLDFDQKYAAHAPKTLDAIAMGLLEHILWYFVRDEGVPDIYLYDEDDGETISLYELKEQHMSGSTVTQDFQIKEQQFTVTHCKFRSTKSKPHFLGYCAAGRLVKEENLKGKLPGLSASISDDRGEFRYTAYIAGPFLDERVYEQRAEFNIHDEVDGLFQKSEVSFKDIQEGVLPLVADFLGESLVENLAAGADRLNEFITKTAPGYRPLLALIPNDELAVDPSISDKDLDLHLHKHAYRIEQRLREDGHDLMNPQLGETEDQYSKRLEEYLQTAAALKQSDLAKYVMHRKVVIDLLELAIEKGIDGRYAREDVVHSLIVPMQIESDNVKFQRQSLWLLDERLAFHEYLASDLPLSVQPVTDDGSGKEPDIVCLQTYNNPMLVSERSRNPHASITVIEIKRPMRNDMKADDDEKHNPIIQSCNYLKRLRGGAKLKNGRPIANAANLPGFVYVLADLTPKMIECCELFNLTVTADGEGYFGYHPTWNAYIQVMSFDGLVRSAKERNRAFFDRLGLPNH